MGRGNHSTLVLEDIYRESFSTEWYGILRTLHKKVCRRHGTSMPQNTKSSSHFRRPRLHFTHHGSRRNKSPPLGSRCFHSQEWDLQGFFFLSILTEDLCTYVFNPRSVSRRHLLLPLLLLKQYDAESRIKKEEERGKKEQ